MRMFTLSVEPLEPINRCRRLTNRSRLRTSELILMISHTLSSCKILTA